MFFEFYFGDQRKHELEAYIAPIEIIDYTAPTELDQPVDFGGVTFFPVAGANISARFRYVELRGDYLYRLVNNEHWNVRVGGGVSYFDTKVQIQQFTGSVKDPNVIAFADVENHSFVPSIAGRARYKFSPRWYAELQGDFWPGDEWTGNVAGLIGWRISPDWELAVGSRWLGSSGESSEVKIDFSQVQWTAHIAKSFY
ncbi:MAG: hypothetical protein QNM00_20900 [Gammaproteobacteria bacterium]|nr:hypothetical protein [Gammaproteobacteria bacterium]